MSSVKPTEDVQPLRAFRANAASCPAQVRQPGRPLVLTQHGKSAAVPSGAAGCEALIEELEVPRDIHLSERELAEDKVVLHGEPHPLGA